MKKSFSLLAAIVLLLSYSSCSQSDPIEENVRKEVRISASFKNLSGDAKVTTRAANNAWQSGDAIGVFMKTAGAVLVQPALSENTKYITTGLSSFIAATEDDKLYYPFDKSKVDFISYYPYTAALSDLNYEVNVADQTDLSAIDLLYSNNVKGVNSTSESVNLSFAHQLTKVVLKISTNYTGKDLATLSAKITNVNTKASFSLVDGSIGTGSEPKDVLFTVNSAGAVAEAILLPDNDLTDNKIVITLGGTSYSYPLSSSTIITSFEKSQQCEYTITIEPTHGPILEGVTAEITDWTTVTDSITVVEDPSETSPEEGTTDPEGVNPPVDPGEGDDIVVGDGTKDNPYRIAEAKNLEPKQSVWIKGYIVGIYGSSEFKNYTSDISKSTGANLALADLESEIDGANTFPVNVSRDSNYNVQTGVNLKDNPDNLKKQIIIKGYILPWFVGEELLGLKKVNVAILDGVEIK